MILSSTVELDKRQIEIVNQSQKMKEPVGIIDQKKLKPDPSLAKLVQINPILVPKQVTLEEIR